MVIWGVKKAVVISDHCRNFKNKTARNEHQEKGRIHCPHLVPEELRSQQ